MAYTTLTQYGWWPLMAIAIVLLVAGAMMRETEQVEWGWLWGFATNSTVVGKLIYVIGALFLMLALNVCLNTQDSRGPSKPSVPFGFEPASIVEWEWGCPVVQVDIDGEVFRVVFGRLEQEGGYEYANERWPEGTDIYANPGGPARNDLQCDGDDVVVGTLWADGYISSIWDHEN